MIVTAHGRTIYGGNSNSGYCPGCQNPSACVCSADLDLDMTLFHSDQGGGVGGRADQLMAKYLGGGMIEDVFVPEYCMKKGKCAAYGDLIQQSNNRLFRLTAKGRAHSNASVRSALQEAGIPTVRQYTQKARLAINKYRMGGGKVTPADDGVPASLAQLQREERAALAMEPSVMAENQRLREEVARLRRRLSVLETEV